MWKNYFLGLFLTVVLTGWAAADSQYGDYTSQYNLKSNRDNHKIVHGYYPYYFSDQARSRYSYCAREKGAYIYGATDKPWPFSGHPYKLESIVVEPAGRVLIAQTSQAQVKALDERLTRMMEEAKKKQVTARVNDTRDLEKIIEQHKWSYASPEMKKALQKDPDNVKADLTDYDQLFQQK